ncbi:MAG: CHAT domain-containing protein, partial [Leptolyngbya sp. SIO1D8]|nr:CHAT domain-containing protein [Leptolyngbya sp. SIO1D8]
LLDKAGGPARLDWAEIQEAFFTADVVTVSTGLGGGENGDITVVDTFDLMSLQPVSTLEFRAAGDIEIPFGLTSSGGVNFDFQADTDNNGSGQIRIDSILSTEGGDIFLQGADAGAAPGIDVRTLIQSNGGDIALISPNADIEVASIDAGGGSISIATPEFIRVIQSPGIVTLGGAAITLEHGGDGVVPFDVGTPSDNGVFEEISNDLTIVPPQSFFESVSFGAIEILTNPPDVSGGDPPMMMPPNVPSDFDPDTVDCFGGCDEFEPGAQRDDFAGGGFAEEFEFESEWVEEFQDDGYSDDFQNGEGRDGSDEDFDEGTSGENFEAEEFVAEDVGGDFEEISHDEWAFDDSFYADEFVDYFDLPVLPEPDFETSQGRLRSLTNVVGIPPALVYARFSPAGAGPVARRLSLKQSQPLNPAPTDVLELVLVTPDSQPKRLVVSGATREKVITAVRQLQIELTDRTRRRRTAYLQPAQSLYRWLVAPLEDSLDSESVGHLSFIMAPGLRSLPLAALHDGEQFIIEKYTVGLMPSLALTDTRYADLRRSPVLAMGASEFTDQTDLPAVPFELKTIVGQLRRGEQRLNEAFTPQRLVELRQASNYPILHLATHGEFRAGGPDNSYIQFWNQRLGLDQIRQLQLHDPPLELLVMSACRTALGDTAAELGFAGLAVQAGVKSALATLWQVSDLETAGLMAEFYAQLNLQPYKAEALRHAQLAMLRGEVTVSEGQLIWNGGSQPLSPELEDLQFGNTQHPYYWAAFTLVGSPW